MMKSFVSSCTTSQAHPIEHMRKICMKMEFHVKNHETSHSKLERRRRQRRSLQREERSNCWRGRCDESAPARCSDLSSSFEKDKNIFYSAGFHAIAIKETTLNEYLISHPHFFLSAICALGWRIFLRFNGSHTHSSASYHITPSFLESFASSSLNIIYKKNNTHRQRLTLSRRLFILLRTYH